MRKVEQTVTHVTPDMGIARLPTDTDTFIYRTDIRRVNKLKDGVFSTIYKHLHLSD